MTQYLILVSLHNEKKIAVLKDDVLEVHETPQGCDVFVPGHNLDHLTTLIQTRSHFNDVISQLEYHDDST